MIAIRLPRDPRNKALDICYQIITTSFGYKEGMVQNESYYGIQSQYTNSFPSDDEGVYIYKRDGKLLWYFNALPT